MRPDKGDINDVEKAPFIDKLLLHKDTKTSLLGKKNTKLIYPSKHSLENSW